MKLSELVRPNILKLKPYASARSEFQGKAKIYLDANENPFDQLGYNRYPDPLQHKLKKKLASLKGVSESSIFCGNGSDEAIDVLIRIFCEPSKDNILTIKPTYGIYKVYADIAQVKCIEVPLEENFDFRESEVLRAATKRSKILFINQPNNPTGNVFQRKKIIHLIENFGGIVVIDEAYIDFAATKSFVPFVTKYPNLIVLQTFSKAFGLAGLRVGVAYAQAEIIDLMNKVKAPYNMSTLTQALALKALTHTKKTDRYIAIILQEKKRLMEAFTRFRFVVKVYPSETNYLLVKVLDAGAVYAFLRQKGIVVRNRSKDYGCAECIRISVGTPTENNTLLATLTLYNQKKTPLL